MENNRKDREISKNLNYSCVDFPITKKDYSEIESLNCICINVFCYENKVIYSVYLYDKSFKDSMDLLLISNGFTNHYVYIKNFNRLMFNKTKNKNKKYFCKFFLQCFSSEKVLNVHNKDCLIINDCQGVKLEKYLLNLKASVGRFMLEFSDRIYADFECL